MRQLPHPKIDMDANNINNATTFAVENQSIHQQT